MVSKDNKYFQLILNTSLFALGNLGSKFIVFILMPLYTNALTTTEYGISELVITGTNLLIPFVSVSIQDATLRFVLDKNNKSGEVLKNTILILAIGSIVTCLLYPFIGLYKAIDGWTQYFLILTIVYMVRNALSIYLKAIGKTKLFAIDSILYTLFLMISNIVLLTVVKLGLKGYFYAIIISTVGSIIILCIFGNVFGSCKKNRVNKKLLKDMVIYSLPMILNNISWWIINSSDKIMIEYFDSASASGIYSVASKIPSILTTLTNIFNQAWIISSVSEYDTTRDGKFYSRTFTVFNCMLVMVASGIVLIIKPFMQIYVGVNFVESWQYVPLLLLGSIFQSYAAFFGAIYTSAKKNVSIMSTTLIAAVINIVLNTILIPTIGIQGAVIATAVAYFVVFVFRMIDSQKYIQFEVQVTQVLLSMVILTGQCVLMITIDGVLRYVTSIVCFAVLFVLNAKTIVLLFNMFKAKLRRR
ncbi:oligosaccharide flippase family protein [Clostridium sp. Marseille-P2415]|uniref:oligosaccharide flippase family protein n=1 Tax=Clostridium sp. Marseille-P2415 TaxID=1805471 RepID=UPI0013563041|nr:oligosaccharide flippase family protein [Clostridium sp. Marseille-P2415]